MVVFKNLMYGLFFSVSLYIDAPVDTGRKLNVHKTFNLRPVPTGAVEEVFS